MMDNTLRKKDQEIYTAKQTFVSTGETHGETIAILAGVKPGDTVVTSGQLKLKNNSLVSINNNNIPTDSNLSLPTNE